MTETGKRETKWKTKWKTNGRNQFTAEAEALEENGTLIRKRRKTFLKLDCENAKEPP